ncbi:MAG: DUF5682 family protein [Aggregatilineales bacterium]
MTSTVHLFGIRHHGPGSARSLLDALYQLEPDIVLLEGPPDGNTILPLLADEQMQPPVALLIYAPDNPKYAAYYPFALFSPEYQGMMFALENDIPVQFIDLPSRYWFHQLKQKRDAAAAAKAALQAKTDGNDLLPDVAIVPGTDSDESDEESVTNKIRRDPLGELAKAAGYDDGERWWDHMIEQRMDSTGLFDAVLEAMTAVREEIDGEYEDHREVQREAHMRQMIRQAQHEGYERIAVICGAWHTPALNEMPPEADDLAILADLEAMPVEATWIPWTHGRLSRYTGYGAGISSPGWYHYLWNANDDNVAVGWLSRVAQLLREKDLDASPAQVIDAVRLANTLAALRGRPVPGLEEFNEAALTVLCFSNTAPMAMIQEKLIVGETMGRVPDDTPMVPLQRDLIKQQQKLKLKVQAEESNLNLDLRNEQHLQRSHLLHRMHLLETFWGQKSENNKKTGTFHEVWTLKWYPELTIQIIEKSAWGNTVYDAATAYALHQANAKPGLPRLTQLVHDVLMADLPDAIHSVVKQLEDEAALTGDVLQLMQSLPALVDVMTYGDVRGTETSMVAAVIEGMIVRTCVGFPSECLSLDDDAAATMTHAMIGFNYALRVLNNPDYLQQWHDMLTVMLDQSVIHGMVRGRACRILIDSRQLTLAEATQQMRLALAASNNPTQSAAWLMGFLEGSGLILLHDDTLLNILDDWVMTLDNDSFETILPLLRRTFASFTKPELRRIGERIKRQQEQLAQAAARDIDDDRADAMMPVLAELLGLDLPGGDNDDES